MLWLLASLSARADECGDLRRAVDDAFASGERCLTPALLGVRDHAAAVGLNACAADALAAHGMSPPRRLARYRDTPPGPKAVRDVISDTLGVYETDNFAIKYGRGVAPDDPALAALGTAFETAWSSEVAGLGMGAPTGADAYKFNVYVGDSGNGAPSAEGAAGYYYVDAEGFGYVVIAKTSLVDPPYAASTAAHEFFHALQDGAGTYTYDGQGAWYWEAGAMWVEDVVYPEQTGNASFLIGLAFLPDLPVNAFLYPDGSLEGYHQYGAFLFVQHLTEITAGNNEIIRRSWLEAPPGGDPLVVLDGLLGDEGKGTIEDAYFDFSGRLATFDWADEATYAAVIDHYGGWSYPGSRRPSGLIFHADGATVAPPRAPATFGSNYWELRGLPDRVEVHFHGDSGPEWAVQVATRRGDVHTRVPVPTDGIDGVAVVDGLAGADEAWLVVSAVDTPVDDGSMYGYTLNVVEPPPADTSGDTDAEERRACACDGGAPASVPMIAATMLIGALRRRPRARRAGIVSPGA